MAVFLEVDNALTPDPAGVVVNKRQFMDYV